MERVRPLITYAVVGHNEAAMLPNAITQAHAARRPGEPVWFVDSASTDGSADLARSLGTEVVEAPLGKGRAVAAAAERCRTSHICVIDADLERTTFNTPARLAQAIERNGADMVVGEFEWLEKPFRPITTTLWDPLASKLFPEAHAAIPVVPLSGFRVMDVELARGPLPPGFGLEVHLNIVGTLDGRRTETVDIGRYRGTVRATPGVPYEVATAVLDVAEHHGRLSQSARPEWELWLEPLLELIPKTTLRDQERRETLMELAARPLPATGRSPTPGRSASR